MSSIRVNLNKSLPVLFIALLSAATGASAVDVAGNGKFERIAFAAYPGIIDQNTPGKQPVPDMTAKVDFSKRKTRAIIEFCAAGNLFNTSDGSRADHGSIQVSAWVDGTQIGDDIQFLTYDDYASVPRCYRWVTTPWNGIHAIRIDWELIGTGITGRFHDRVLTVHYR